MCAQGKGIGTHRPFPLWLEVLDQQHTPLSTADFDALFLDTQDCARNARGAWNRVRWFGLEDFHPFFPKMGVRSGPRLEGPDLSL